MGKYNAIGNSPGKDSGVSWVDGKTPREAFNKYYVRYGIEPDLILLENELMNGFKRRANAAPKKKRNNLSDYWGLR